MNGKCAAVNCEWGEGLSVEQCPSCSNYVHHMCSNELYDGGDLSERFCSVQCVVKKRNTAHDDAAP